MTPALADLADTFGLTCARCGKPGPDMFENEAGAEALLNPRPLPHHAGIVPAFGIRRITQADILACRPVHRRCRDGWKPPERHDGGSYDILRSVA